jgi:hypothetical protein
MRQLIPACFISSAVGRPYRAQFASVGLVEVLFDSSRLRRLSLSISACTSLNFTTNSTMSDARPVKHLSSMELSIKQAAAWNMKYLCGRSAVQLSTLQWITAKCSLKQCRAEQSRAEQSRAEQSRAEQSRAEQSRAEQSRAAQRRAEQSRAEQRRAQQRRA